MARSVALLCALGLVSLAGAASARAATACTWNPVCPYQGIEILGAAEPASLDGPLAVALTPDGDVVVADRAKESVREFTATGSLVKEIGTPGSYVAVNGVAVDPSTGEIWVSDNMGVHGFTAAGAPEATAGGNGVGPYQADGITVGPNGNLYVFNGDTSTIYEYSPSGAILTTWPAPNAEPAGELVPLPTTLAVDAQGDVYIATVDIGPLHEFSPSGALLSTGLAPPAIASIAISGSTLYAQYGQGSGSEIESYSLGGNPEGRFTDDGPGNQEDGSTFAVGPAGIFTATADHTIQQFALGGTLTGTWGGLAVDDFQATEALADAAGNIYVIDPDHARVIRYDAQGDPPTVFADLSAYGGPVVASLNAQGDLVVDTSSGEVVTLGPGGSVLSAVANDITPNPEGTQISYSTTDSAGNVYMDAFHGSPQAPVGDITKYSPSGQLLETIDVDNGWGPGIPGPIAVDAQGNVYTATESDVREFAPNGTMIAVWQAPTQAVAISVAANGDVYLTFGATVIRYYDFLHPLPPVPPQSLNPMSQSVAGILKLLPLPTQSSSSALRTTISCTGTATVSCVGELMLTAPTPIAAVHAGRAKAKTMVTVLGSKRFSVAVGASAAVTVTLDRTARRLLSTRATVDATLSASYQAGVNSSTVTRKVVLHGHPRKRSRRR